MATWNCPHCNASWHTAGICHDCGYGTSMPPVSMDALTQQLQQRRIQELVPHANGTTVAAPPAPPLPGPQLGAALAAQELHHQAEEERAQQEQVLREAFAPPPLTAEETQIRSLAVENHLRGELQLAQERIAQLTKQLETQQQQLAQGFQRLLQPLLLFWDQTLHRQPVLATIITDSVALLHRYREALQAPPPPMIASTSGPEQPSGLMQQMQKDIGELQAHMTTIIQAMRGMRQQGITPVPPEGGWGSFVVTDDRAQQVEQALLDAQRGTQFGFRG